MYSEKKIADRLIDKIDTPRDLRKFALHDLQQIADELREDTINLVSNTGGHLGAGLGVIELTVALHYVFNTPYDQLVWDVGHQTYPHKILTGRKEQMHTLRKKDGLSGFPKRNESIYDTFGVGHSSTSISAALGMAVARDLKGEDFRVIAVIGDGALTAGMAYEAMNNAGHLKNRMIVILNDNEMSIAPNVGAMKQYLTKLMSSQPFLTFRSAAKNIVEHMPEPFETFAKKTKRYAKDIFAGGNFFEEIGFHYVGPIDGHDVETLATILTNLRDDTNISSPILLHIKTCKGKGFDAPFSCGESYHAVAKFDPATKEQFKPTTKFPTYTKICGETLTQLANIDESVVAITAAMPSGTGLNIFAKAHPDRCFDVGIAEQHAVTFAAGLATQGLKPFVAIYSTFLQRAYDQVVHDVAIQSLPVRFLLDRAGLVGGDGATHAGSYDLAYLSCIPNMVIMAPSDEAELASMIATAHQIDDRPCAIRYPRGEGIGAVIPDNIEALKIGKGRIIKQGTEVAIISLGTRLEEALKAQAILENQGISTTIMDARFAKPLDEEMIATVAKNHDIVISVEEGSSGGFGATVSDFLMKNDLMFRPNFKFRSLHLPDFFIDQDNPFGMYETAGLNANSMVDTIINMRKK